jgi:hypothetical protein
LLSRFWGTLILGTPEPHVHFSENRGLQNPLVEEKRVKCCIPAMLRSCNLSGTHKTHRCIGLCCWSQSTLSEYQPTNWKLNEADTFATGSASFYSQLVQLDQRRNLWRHVQVSVGSGGFRSPSNDCLHLGCSCM